MFSWLKTPLNISFFGNNETASKNTFHGVDITKYRCIGKTKLVFFNTKTKKVTKSAYVYFFIGISNEKDRIAKLVAKSYEKNQFDQHPFVLVNVAEWVSGFSQLWEIDIDNPQLWFIDYIFKNYGHTYDYKTGKWLTGMPVDPKYLKALNDQRDVNIKLGNKKKIVTRVSNEENNSNVIKIDFKTKKVKSIDD